MTNPLAKAPGRSPAIARGPKQIPNTNGVKRTMAAGPTILLRAAVVEIAIHLLWSGSKVPFLIPGLFISYLLTSSTI
jgi:hypothetical protein